MFKNADAALALVLFLRGHFVPIALAQYNACESLIAQSRQQRFYETEQMTTASLLRNSYVAQFQVGSLFLSYIRDPKKIWTGAHLNTLRPRKWHAAQVPKIKDFLEELQAKYPNFFAQINANGYQHITRAETECGVTSGVINPTEAKIMLLKDVMFSLRNDFVSRGTRHPYWQMLLLHELAHAYDLSTKDLKPVVSYSPNFINKFGFFYDSTNNEWSLPRMRRGIETRKCLYEGNRYHPELDGWARKNKFVTYFSIYGEDPYEVFAEAVTYSHFEPRLVQTLNPKLYRWIKQDVLR